MREQIAKELYNALNKFDTIQSKYKFYSENAFNLLLGTIAQESNFKYTKQLGNGPARSYFQIEPATAIDILHNYVRYPTSKGIMYRKELMAILKEISDIKINNINYSIVEKELLNNFEFAVFIARLCYYRQNFKILDIDFNDKLNEEQYAIIWKRFYNTNLGHGTTEQFIKNYNIFEIDNIKIV